MSDDLRSQVDIVMRVVENDGDILFDFLAVCLHVESKHGDQLGIAVRNTEDRVDESGLAGPVFPDESHDSAAGQGK